MTAARALLLLLVAALGACSKPADPPAAGSGTRELPAAELKRGRDACAGYVERVCACARTVPAADRACTLAQALPQALEVAGSLGTNPEAERRDVRQAADAARKTIKECIEQTARLPALGCP